MKKTDVLIIGGGALGTFHAFHALNAGLSVRLLEKNDQPQEATVRNFGQVVPSGMDIKWQRFGRRSLEIYKQLQATTDITVRNNGTVYIASNAEEMQLIEELRTINANEDYTSELLTAQQCLDKYPGLRADYCDGALFFPEEVTVDARQMIHRVLDILRQNENFHYHPATVAQEVQKVNGECTIQCNTGELFKAAKTIICSGAEFKLLFPDVFNDSDLEISKLQMMQTVPQPTMQVPGNILTGLSIRRYESFRACPSYASINAQEDPNAFWKKWNVHILFKQHEDGSFIIGDSHEYMDAREADKIGFDIYPQVNDYMIDEAKKIFDLEDWTMQRVWTGIYSQCKTNDLFQRTIDDDIHIVTGIGGKGMTGSAGFSEANIKDIFQVTPHVKFA